MTSGPQPGILHRPPEHLLVAALSLQGSREPATTTDTLDLLREVVHRELASDLDEITATTPKGTPSTETGELGAADGWEQTNLSITVGFSAACYGALGHPAGDGQRPADLVEVPWSDFKDNPQITGSGDVVLHISADSVFVVEHVLRRVEHSLTGRLTTIWTLAGTQRYTSPGSKASKGDARALIGFHDGLSNLEPHRNPQDAALVFVDPATVKDYPANPAEGPQPAPTTGQSGYNPGQPTGPIFPPLRPVPTHEPDSAKDGTYMFVRGSVFDTASWDVIALGEQEASVGRFKSSGAFLDHEDTTAHRDDAPDFMTTPTNVAVPPNSHVRRANPRTKPEDLLRRILRRGYPLVGSGAGSMQRGLLFVSFSRSLSTQVEFIFKAWLRNDDFPGPQSGPDPLLAFDKIVIAGGYYFVPPLQDVDEAWSWVVPPQS